MTLAGTASKNNSEASHETDYFLQKDSCYLSSEYGAIPDDELFDDHYGYEGPQVTIAVGPVRD